MRNPASGAGVPANMTVTTHLPAGLTGSRPRSRPRPQPRPETRSRRHNAAFWIVGYTFAVTMAFSALPTPLYVLYQARDGFSTFLITVIFADRKSTRLN